MVTRAIERAQNTVEQKNAEVRKDVLKYDEVMNEQRKVIYERRMQVIDGENLREYTLELLETTFRARRRGLLPERVRRGMGSRAPRRRARPLLPDEVLRRRPRTGDDRRAARSRASGRRGGRVLRRARADLPRWRGDRPGARAPDHVADHRPTLARAPRGDGLPPRRDPPARHRPDRPARRLAARGFRDVREADGGDRRRLPALHHPRPGDRRTKKRRRTTPRPATRPRTTRSRSLARSPATAARSTARPPSTGSRCPAARQIANARTGSTTPLPAVRAARSRQEQRQRHKGRTQRPVLVRERAQVQALPRRELNGRGRPPTSDRDAHRAS